MRLPPLFFVVSSVAGLCLAAGILGLTGSGLVPALTDPTLAWTCVGVGVALEGWATSMLLGAAGAARARGGAGTAGSGPAAERRMRASSATHDADAVATRAGHRSGVHPG